jgi:hypothetical protein
MHHIVTVSNFDRTLGAVKLMFISVFYTDDFDERGTFEDLA